MIVHLLHNGHAICGTMGFPPRVWPADHVWLGLFEYVRSAPPRTEHNNYPDAVYCKQCVEVANADGESK